MNPWIRLYRESLHDPKIVTLSDRQHRAWHNLLLVADDTGRLPSMRDIASHLRMSCTDCEQVIHELVEAELIDVDAMSGAPSYRIHGWEKRQFTSDNSTARSRKHRNKTNCNDSATLQERSRNDDATPPDTEPESETDTTSLPSESDAARTKGRKDFKFDLKGGRAGRGSVDDLVKRAEGLGLPVDDLLRTLDRNRPEKPGGYFLGMCVKRLKERLPMVDDGVLRAALNGRSTEYTLVTALLVAEMEST